MIEKQLGDWLCTHGHLRSDQLAHALEVQKSAEPHPSLGAILVSLKYIDEPRLTQSIAELMGTEVWDLENAPPNPELKSLLPAQFAQSCKIIAQGTENGFLRCVTSGPVSPQDRARIEFLVNRPIRLAVAPESAITHLLQEIYGVSVESLIAGLAPGEAPSGDDSEVFIHDLREMAQEPTLINLVNAILSTAIEERASDIHIEPFESELKVKYRIDGTLQEMPPPPKQFQSAIISRVKIMAGMDIAERYVPQDGQIRVNLPQAKVDIRVSTVPTVYGESVVLRLLNKDEATFGLTQLGMDRELHEKFSMMLERPYGIILVCGPTGSGKTTTLYSALHQIYSPEKKIITIEDPVEYQMPGINQIPVRPKRGLTFAAGLRAMLRQDPDIIMVGEIRDKETADISIRAALTGHLVFSTLHTNDAPGAVTRLIDMGVEPFLISSSVQAALGQRLVRRLCAACKKAVPADPASIPASLRAAQKGPPLRTVYEPGGCEECSGRGFRGRLGIFELLTITEDLHALIQRNASSSEIKDAAKRNMRTMREDGWEKIRGGLTTVAEVLQATQFDD